MKYKLSNGLEHFWQWDTSQSIILPIGIPTVHFKWGGQSIKVSPSDGVCPIPDELLQVTDDLIFYTYNKDHTIDGSFIKIYARPKPDGYVYTPTEIKSFDDLDKRITALEQGGGVAGVSSVNGQSGAVTITAESLGAATSDEVTSAVNSAWTEAQKTLQPMFDAKQPKGDYLTQKTADNTFAKQSDIFETGLEPTFTNVLPLSQNADGEVQNALGYTYIIISGAGNETDATNWVSTGYIPVKQNDVLRFENFGLPIGASSYCRIITYKSDHTVASQGQINSYDAANNSTGMNYITSPSGGTNTVVLDNDGTNIIQLTMCRPGTAAYVRFTVPVAGVSSKSVITVNEEITYEAGYGTKLNGNIQVDSSQIVGDLGQRSPWDILPGAHLAIAYSSIGRMAINTKEHFQDCCKNYGYNVLKCDVRPTSDGELVLCHDAGFTLDTNGRITAYNAENSTNIYEMTAAQCVALEHADSKSYGLLGYYAKPCLIGDYLDICRAYGKVAFITIRDEYMDVVVPKLLEELRAHNMMYHTIINSMTYASLVKWRAADSIVCLNYTLSRSANITSTEIDQVIDLGNAMIGGFGFGTATNESDITCDFTYANAKKIRVINAIGYVSGAYENCIAAGYDGLQIGYEYGSAALTENDVLEATDKALKQAKESGEFNGTSVNWRGEYSSTAKYEKMDAVIYDGSGYIFVGESSIGAIPGIDEEWSLMVEKGDDATVTSAAIANAMGLSGFNVDDQIAVSSVDETGTPISWKKKSRDILNVRDFGAKGDGSTDDTAAIQAALDAASALGVADVRIPCGTYKVSAKTADNNFYAALTIHGGQRLIFDAATLQLAANGYDFYAVLNVHDVDNVTIEGGLTIIGDRESHTATTGESGHGIRIVNSHNVHVSDVSIRYTWGDGVCVGGNGTMAEISQNVTLERISTYKCSRNGLSIIEADGVVVRDCDFSYTDRTDPQYGIDIEPNLGTADNIHIERVKMLNNGVGSFSLYAKKCTQRGRVTLRDVATDKKTIIYTSGDNSNGKFDVTVDRWRHTQQAGETIQTLRLSGSGTTWIRDLHITNASAERVLLPVDAANIRIDGMRVDDNPSVSAKGTISIPAASAASLDNVVISGLLSRNPAEVTWYSGNQLTVDNLQDTVVNLNEHLTTGGSSESYKLLMCDKTLVLGTALSAKARVFIPYAYGNVNPFRVVNTTATEVHLYTTVSAGITFVGDVPGGSSANSATLAGNASYEVRPMLADGLVYVRRLDIRTPTKTSEITNDSGYQTGSQVEATVTGKGYQTEAQVGAAITAAIGVAMEASY